jgi:polyribonucleotide nucleotidyltransferase
MHKTHKKFSLPELGLEVEIGKFAKQAHGSAWMKVGKTIVLSTVVSSIKDVFLGFFPLTVEYRERPSSAGKIPGGYFKREGKLSDKEVLTSRLIDRPIRPLFPADYLNEVQIISTVYSSDGGFPTDVLSLIGSSLALTVSNIPFFGPVGAVQISKIGEEWKFNSSYEKVIFSDSSIIVAGTKEGICMVEGQCNDLSEEKLIDILFQAHEQIKIQVDWQNKIKEELGVVKPEYSSFINLSLWVEKVEKLIPENFLEELLGKTKEDRSLSMKNLKSEVLEKFKEEIDTALVAPSIIGFALDGVLKKKVSSFVVKKNVRMDGRKFNDVRPIWSEVGLLPCTHGSSVFTRGETQALASVTLGSAQDAQRIEPLLDVGPDNRTFMLHYNFPPFSVGEVRPMRAVGRREVGHGHLAEGSFYNVIPSQEEFPYTVRSVVDILESNGSSSMATVCSTSMALMDAGVPVKDMVGGIAMGLIRDSDDGKSMILTDILGEEDAYGLMDFKVTGTEKGIMAFQLDIKDKVGLKKDLFSQALDQAKVARLHILNEMKKTISSSRPEISKCAPQITSFKVAQDKIGAIIGPGGKVIKEIVATTGTQVDINDDGTVRLFSKDQISSQKAEQWIKILVGEIEVGAVFNGTIKRIIDFGLFVELVPGREGLVHISTINRNKQRTLSMDYKVNDKLKVKVVSYDDRTDRVRLISPDLQ